MANDAKKGVVQRFDLIIENLIDSVVGLSDEELLEEIKEEGLDPDNVANHTRSILLGAFKNYEQRNLRVARQHLEQSQKAKERKQRSNVVPKRHEDRIPWLQNYVRQHPGITAQFRDFKEMSPEDMESCLDQLEELGLLGDPELS